MVKDEDIDLELRGWGGDSAEVELFSAELPHPPFERTGVLLGILLMAVAMETSRSCIDNSPAGGIHAVRRVEELIKKGDAISIISLPEDLQVSRSLQSNGIRASAPSHRSRSQHLECRATYGSGVYVDNSED